MKGFNIAIAAAFAAMIVSAPALSQEYPERPITVVVPFSPGGTTDIIARTVLGAANDIIGEQFVVENRPGAGGTIGADEVARANSDGYTLLFYSINISFAEALYEDLAFAPENDLAPISLVARAPNILAVPADAPYDTLGEFIAAAQESPGDKFFASTGTGAANHLAVEQFMRLTDTDFEHIPYGGGGPAVVDLIAGHVDLMIESAGSVMQQIDGGKLKALATTGGERIEALPDVPTMQEQGVNFEYHTWFGVWAPAGTPDSIREQLNEVLAEALEDPSVVENLDAFGVQPATMSVSEFTEFVSSEIALWGALIEEEGIRSE